MKKAWIFAGALAAILSLGACGGGGGGGVGVVPGASSSASSSSSSSSIVSSSSSSSSSISSSSAASTAAVTIHMIGDSTMTAYTADRRPQMGWGEALPQFFNSDVTIKNWALGGRSSRSFYYEASRWPAIVPQIQTGDYVIIQFAHNDQKLSTDYATFGTYAFCSDGTGNGETCTGSADGVDPSVDKAEHSYYQFLKRYVTETRAKGGIPILMSPIVRKYFSGSTITAEGQHNVGIKGTESFVRGDYVAAMKAIATTYSVPIVDITADTKQIVESYGDAAATANLYISADSTHPQVLFANLIAKRAVEGLKALNILKSYMVPVTSLIASPNTLAWGTRYVSVPMTKTLTLSAFDLSPATGTVTITAPSSEFVLSFDNTTWTSSVAVDYTNNAFTKTVYVKFTPTAAVAYSGNISFSLGGVAMATSVAVSGTGVAAAAGVDSYAKWFTAGSDVTALADGLVTGSDVAVSGLTATTSKALDLGGVPTTAARFTVLSTSRVNTEYLQFAIKPASGTFNVDAMGGYLTTSGGSTVQADLEYSTNADFSGAIKLNADAAMSFSKDTLVKKEFGVTIQVTAAQTLYVRLYPWNTAGTTGKSIAVYDFRVSGKVAP